MRWNSLTHFSNWEDFDETKNNLILLYLLFADDLVLFAETAEALQEQISGLFNYTSLWHLIVNLIKTKILIFNHKGPVSVNTFKFGNELIEITDEYKYLGVFFKTSGQNSFKNTYTHLANQPRKGSYSVLKQSRPVVGKLSPNLSFKVFDSQILPILEYGSEIWFTGKELPELERVQTNFIKSTLGVRRQTSTLAIYGHTDFLY